MIAWKHTSNVSSDTNNARSRGRSCLLAISAWRCHIINRVLFLTGGTPSERRGDRGEVLLQDWLPSTASSPLQRTSPEEGFQGGVYDENMIAQQSSLDVSRDLNEWSHSWEMRKQRKMNQKEQPATLTAQQGHCAWIQTNSP